MIGTTGSRGGLLVGAALCCLSCKKDLPAREWTSDHFRYFSRSTDNSVCADLLPVLEQHAETISTAIGIDRPIVTYYKFASLDDFAGNSDCGNVSGCTSGATVESPVGFDRHELIHAYMAQFGLPPWLLVEGTAVALSCEHRTRPTGTWQDAYSANRHSPQLYGAGGWLVGHLLRTFPPDRLVALYRSVPNSASAAAFAAAFQQTYGTNLDDEWAAAIASPKVPLFCPWECGRPPFALDGQPTPLMPACGAGSIQLTFDLPATGVTRWTITGDGYASLRSCDGNEEPGPALSGTSAPGGFLAPLDQGSYFIDAVVDSGGSCDLAGSSGAPDVFSADCASAPAVPDDLFAAGNLSIFYPSATADRFTLFAAGTSRRGSLWLVSDSPGTAQLCTGCDLQSCSSVTVEAPLMLEGIPAGAVLRVLPGAAVTAGFQWF